MLLLAWLAHVAEIDPRQLTDARAWSAGAGFVASLFPPRLDLEFASLVADATWRTIAIATAGVALGWIVALPLTLASTQLLSVSALGRPMAARPAIVRTAIRWCLVALRSIPELVWGLLLVRIVGLGPTAGVLAIALTYVGMFGKVNGEILESIDPAPVRALLHHGSSRLAALLYGALPQAAPEIASYTVFRWECAIRSSVVLGFVGAGGLGQQMDLSLKMLAGGEVTTLLLVFVALVAMADVISDGLRRAIERGATGWWAGAAAALTVVSLSSIDLEIAALAGPDARVQAREFLGGFVPPDLSPNLLDQMGRATIETFAMSVLGTVMAVVIAAPLALLRSRSHPDPAARSADRWHRAMRSIAGLVFNLARAVPELVWASLAIVVVGLGPMAGTLALTVHTAGVLGRLFAETLENVPVAPALALRAHGVGRIATALYATLPLAAPQAIAYALYRWENNIRAATVLGVVGAGGLGQMLYYHLSLFQVREAASIIIAIVGIVLVVDWLSLRARRALQ